MLLPMMLYRIEFYNARVRSEILAWPSGIAARFVAITERMIEHSPDLGLPYTRAMGGGMFEIRAQGRDGIGRAFFCSMAGRRIVILHGFIKKTQKTPAAELAIARSRLKEIRNAPTSA
jgi:phage-related protein